MRLLCLGLTCEVNISTEFIGLTFRLEVLLWCLGLSFIRLLVPSNRPIVLPLRVTKRKGIHNERRDLFSLQSRSRMNIYQLHNHTLGRKWEKWKVILSLQQECSLILRTQRSRRTIAGGILCFRTYEELGIWNKIVVGGTIANGEAVHLQLSYGKISSMHFGVGILLTIDALHLSVS